MSYQLCTVSDQPGAADESEELTVVVETGICYGASSRMKERFKALEDALIPKAIHQNPKIQRAPITLLVNNISEEFFHPKILSIGPIHHGKPEYQYAEKFKLKLAAMFIKHCGKTSEVLFQKIKGDIIELRDCFEEEVIKDKKDDDLAWILLVDGCAILYHMYCMENGSDRYKELKVKTDHIVLVQHDLFLLENQIPFKVLELLIDASTKEIDWKRIIENFISRNTMEPVKHQEQQQQGQQHDLFKDENPTHLLDLLHTRLLGSADKQEEKPKPGLGKTKEEKPKPGFLDYVFREGKTIEDWHSFRNAKELTEVGIHLKPSETSHLRDVSFGSKLFASLHLPPILVDDSTKSKFLNLVAYEMCPDYENNYEVTSYICFLDTLIDHPQDVKELRLARILFNLLGSDKEVATLFNSITTGLVPNPDIYIDVKKKIEGHCSNKVKTWFAKTYYIHFSTPWAITGFLAALFALFLTSVQTWLTAFAASKG